MCVPKLIVLVDTAGVGDVGETPVLNRKYYSLIALPLQQEEPTEAALTLVPHAVVLAIHTHSILFCGTLRHPVLNLIKGQRQMGPPE